MAFDVSDPADILYEYGTTDVSDAVIVYSYVVDPLETSDCDVVYRYGHRRDRWDRQHGCWGWTTQEICNLFPRWHAARINVFGDTQKLINAWGQNYDVAKMEYARFRKDLFVQEAALEQPDLFGYAPVVDFKVEAVKQRLRNMLLNPSFALKGLARRNHPMWWCTDLAATTGSVALVDCPVFIGSYSARLHAASGERAYLRQAVQVRVVQGESLTASLWYLVPIPEDVLEADELRAGIYLTVMYRDGSMDIARAALDLGTDGQWRRASATIALTEECVFATIGIQIENDGDDDVRVYAGAAQLEVSPIVTPWTESGRTYDQLTENVPIESPVDAYVDMGTQEMEETIVAGEPVSYVGRMGRTMFFTSVGVDMWADAVPHRATTSLEEDPPSAVQRDTLGWYANPEDERYTTRWRIVDNRLEQYNNEIEGEVIGRFDIAEMHLEEDGTPNMGVFSSDDDPDFTRVLESLCVFKDRLWVVCKETEGGVTKRVVKVLNPRSRWPVPLTQAQEAQNIQMHLECIGDFEISVTTGSVTYVGVVEEDPDKLLIQIGEDFYVVEMEFPYYQFDFDRNQAVLRTVYAGDLLTV
jgi:hypothetical protein